MRDPLKDDSRSPDFYINTAMRLLDLSRMVVVGSKTPYDSYADACWALAWAMAEARKRSVIDSYTPAKGQSK